MSKKSHFLSFIHRLKPWQRLGIALGAALVVYFLINNGYTKYFRWLFSWNIFAIIFLTVSWITLFTLNISEIKKKASVEDGSKPFVYGLVFLFSLGGLWSVLQLLEQTFLDVNKYVMAAGSVFGMFSSWAIVHTLFTFHYAHMFYGEGRRNNGLQFPGEEAPDYLDFAYFAFGIGSTFQVSDVAVTNKNIRRTVLAHSLLSFLLNTIVIALSINLVLDLVKSG